MAWPPPVVHSLSINLSNHRIMTAQPYNEPCPKVHPETGFWADGTSSSELGEPEPGAMHDLECPFLWRLVLALISRRYSARRRNLSSRASCRMPSPSTKKS